MNNEFWSRSSKRLTNPTLTSKLVTNLLVKQPQQLLPSKPDFTKPIKISERPSDFIRRSQSQYFSRSVVPNPEKPIPKIQKTSSSRMSNFGSSSLQRLSLLGSDVEVYEKQRKDRHIDIITQKPHEYRDVIKVFPKYRFQTLDNNYWRRKSFIEGLPQNAYNHYSVTGSSLGNSRKLQGIGKLASELSNH